MTYCAYCGQPATRKIVSIPEDVCLDHAREFWTGLLMFVTNRPGSDVNHAGLRLVPSRRDDERPAIRLAS